MFITREVENPTRHPSQLEESQVRWAQEPDVNPGLPLMFKELNLGFEIP